MPSRPCFARVDAGELELALLNLAVNARDAMPNGGRLTLSAVPIVLSGDPKYDGLSGDFIAFRVIDSGEGMPPEVLARVFEPFFTTKPPGQGTGLGLSQVYGFAKQSGGAVAIDTAPSLGSTVTLLIPRASAPTDQAVGLAALPAADGDAAVAQAAAPKAKVLLVEDSEEVAQVSREYLERIGHTVVTVTNGVDALAALSNVRGIDIVLSDIVMPGEMDGLDVARQVRMQFPGLPIILVTGYAAAAPMRRAGKALRSCASPTTSPVLRGRSTATSPSERRQRRTGEGPLVSGVSLLPSPAEQPIHQPAVETGGGFGRALVCVTCGRLPLLP